MRERLFSKVAVTTNTRVDGEKQLGEMMAKLAAATMSINEVAVAVGDPHAIKLLTATSALYSLFGEMGNAWRSRKDKWRSSVNVV